MADRSSVLRLLAEVSHIKCDLHSMVAAKLDHDVVNFTLKQVN